jgi:pimeloyl-ACP methyl ester carboxylesterase
MQMLAGILAAALSIHPCSYSELPARCGTLTVPENRAVPHGRSIALRFVAVASRSEPQRDPVFVIAGGPGQSAVDAYRGGFAADGFLRTANRDRAVVLLDQRGAGASSPMRCDLVSDRAAMFAYLYPTATVARCRRILAASHDLNSYGTNAATDDLDALREALDYRKIVLYGGSYGTDVALVYLRRHAVSAAAEVLEGVAPPQLLLPLPFPKGAQRALDDLTASCRNDPACNRNFPHFATEFESMLAGARNGGIPVEGGTISFEVLADAMRHVMYDEYTASYLPLIVHRWATGDSAPLGKTVTLLAAGITGSLAMGMNLSITCAESLPFIDQQTAAAAATGTFMGTSRYDAQRAACAIWNVRPVSESFLRPIESNVPVLMIGGAADPATPPQFGARALAGLPNGRQLLVPHGGHDVDSPCTMHLELQFLNGYDARSLDASCLRSHGRPPFATTFAGLL